MGLLLRSVCSVTCIMAHTACLTPDGAMLRALLLAGHVCNIHPSTHASNQCSALHAQHGAACLQVLGFSASPANGKTQVRGTAWVD